MVQSFERSRLDQLLVVKDLQLFLLSVKTDGHFLFGQGAPNVVAMATDLDRTIVVHTALVQAAATGGLAHA